jgi:hypothetical protein
MRLSTRLLGLLALVGGLSMQDAAAQATTCPATPSECVVQWADPVTGEPIINALSATVAADVDRPADRVYKLQRGGFYFNEERVANAGFHLRLIGQTAAEGQATGQNVCGAGGNEDCGPAIIQRFRRSDGTVDGIMLESAGDGNGGFTLRNLWIMGQDNTGVTANYEPIVVNSSASRFTMDNVIFDRNDWHHLGFKAGLNNKIYIRNSSFRNISGNTQRYEGRGIRLEAGADTLMFENNTFFNITSFPVQSEARPVEYFVFNHNTLVNFGLAFNAGGIWKLAYIANNVMVNPFFQGESADLYTNPTRVDPFSGVFNIGTLPAAFGFENDRRILLANNAYWRSPSLESYYNTFDPIVRAQPLVSDTTQGFFDRYPGMVIQGNLNVEPAFTSAPLTAELYDLMRGFIEDVSVAGTPTPFASVVWDPGRDPNPLAINWPLPENLAYSNANLQTAGTDGLPVGNLNYFPTQLATYLANRGTYLSGLSELTGGAPVPPIAAPVVQAETGTPAGGAAVASVEGETSLFLESSGSILWNFTLPATGTYGLNINTDLRGSDPRGQNFVLDGGAILRNQDGFGETFFCTSAWSGGTCAHPVATATGPTVLEVRQDHLLQGTLVLDAGAHTLRVTPSWGFQAFSTVDIVDAGGVVVESLTPPEALTEGAREECADAAAYCPQGFQTVNLTAGGSVAIPVTAPTGTQSAEFYITYTSEAGGSAEVLVDGVSAGTLSLPATEAGAAGQGGTARVGMAPGAHVVTVSSTTGGIALDYVQAAFFEGAVATEPLPEGWSLDHSFPNPTADRATIRFQLGETADVNLTVYDVLGRTVSVLANGPMAAGPHEVRFDAGALASGTYLYRFVTPVGVQTRRFSVVR